MHASCKLKTTFIESCSTVRSEILYRINSNTNWIDPHNAGSYKLVEESSTLLLIERVTGTSSWTKYLDKLTIEFHPLNTGCIIEACSESQGTSILDHSTNYCNIHDLYCSDDSCKSKKQLHYTEEKTSCSQSALQNCYAI